MFSYTDDAIVTSSPTGRHLSTVIRRPAAIGPLDWNEHAEQVCKVLNELDRTVKATRLTYSLSLEPGVQVAGRPKRDAQLDEAHVGPFATAPNGEQVTELELPIFYSQGVGPCAAEPSPPKSACVHVEATDETGKERYADTLNVFENQFGEESARVRHLETALLKAQMALKEPIEVPQAVISALAIPGNSAPVHGNGRTFKRGE